MLRHPEGTRMKKLIIGLVLVMCLLASFSCAKPTPTPSEDETPPIISGVSSSDISATSAIITWTTDELVTSQVEYGDTTDYGFTTTLDEELVTNHSVSLSELIPDTTYHYRVRSQDSSNNEAVSGEYTFITTGIPPQEAETTVPETRIEELPYSWTEGDFLITIHEVFKASPGENWEDYRVRISYKNTLKRTSKADIQIGDLKLKTDAGNLYDLESSGGTSCYQSFAPEQSQEGVSCSFRIRKTEKPVELWFYKHGCYAEEPNIIFELSEPTLIAKIGDTIPDCAGKQNLSLSLLWWKESKIAVDGPYIDGYYTFTAKPNMKFIILAYEFRNNGVEEQTTPYLKVGKIATTAEGYHYGIFTPPSGIHSEEYKPRKATEEEIDTLIGNSGGYEYLLPEESIKGRVTFEIPEDATPMEATIEHIPYIIKF